MARTGRKIKVYKHAPSGTEVQIRIGQDMKFFASLDDGSFFQADTAAELEKKLEKAISENFTEEWTPVIEIEPAVRGYEYEKGKGIAGIEISRFYYSPRGTDGGVAVKFEKSDLQKGDAIRDHVKTSTNLRGKLDLPDMDPPSTRWKIREHQEWYLPYDEALWHSLVAVKEGLRSLNEWIMDNRADVGKMKLLAAKLSEIAPASPVTDVDDEEDDEE